VANSKARAKPAAVPQAAESSGWTSLTWDDLESWAGSRSVERGRSYQRGGRVRDLRVSAEGQLLATVQGSEAYATTVSLQKVGKKKALASECTCPIGNSCKHAVAVIAEYLDAVANGRTAPRADDDDERWAWLEEGDESDEDEGDELDDEPEEDDFDDDAPILDYSGRRKPVKGVRGSNDVATIDKKIEEQIRGQSREELAELALSLIRRFPEVLQEYREQATLREGNVKQLLAEARQEITRASAEPGWRNHWDRTGYTPDYERARSRLERLLELGHADEVVSLGREFIDLAFQQVEQSNDEGETAAAVSRVLPAIFQAVLRSSLSVSERLLFAIDAELADQFDLTDAATALVFSGDYTPSDWSVVADELAGRIKPVAATRDREADSFSRDYARDRLVGQIANALRNAGRASEIRPLYEREARITRSYERIVRLLLEQKCIPDAERWAREGIAATVAQYPGIAASLANILREIARTNQQWDVDAAHSAYRFFEHPASVTFHELLAAARQAGVEEAVREAAFRFLETGTLPYQSISPPTTTARLTRARSMRKAAPARGTTPPAPDLKLTIDPSWPLPVPDYLVPLLNQPHPYSPGPRPHLDVLLKMAIDAKLPDEILRWYDRMQSVSPHGASHHADEVAGAIADVYPERSIEAYRHGLDDVLPQANPSAYEAARRYLIKLRPLYQGLGRLTEWTALVNSIREMYRNRRKFMELLDNMDGKTIVEAVRKSRKG
jgi:uncharacterized Zn finger protein